MAEAIVTTIEQGVGIIELNRPDKFNCLSLEVHRALDAARREFEADDRVRALLIRAMGDNFCTGADLEEVKAKLGDGQALDAFIGLGMETLRGLETSPLPVVVAVQGLALAGGIELMLAADICFAGKTARLGDQHAQFGLIPGWGGSQRLARIMGLRRALDLMFSARWLKAEEAREAGLVNHVVDESDLHKAAFDYAVTLTTRSRDGLALMKRLARDGLDMTLDQGLRLERDAAVQALCGADVRTGLAAFETRTVPQFK